MKQYERQIFYVFLVPPTTFQSSSSYQNVPFYQVGREKYNAKESRFSSTGCMHPRAKMDVNAPCPNARCLSVYELYWSVTHKMLLEIYMCPDALMSVSGVGSEMAIGSMSASHAIEILHALHLK